MRISASFLAAAVAVLPRTTYAVKGVISDSLTSDSQGCYSLCGLNNACLTALYQVKCHECWLLDCKVEFAPEGIIGEGKDTIEIKPICDSALVPKARDAACNGAPSTARTTSAAAATTTNGAAGTTKPGANGSTAAWHTSFSCLSLSAVLAAAVLVAV